MFNYRQAVILDVGPPRRLANRRWGYLALLFSVIVTVTLFLHPWGNAYARSAYENVRHRIGSSSSSSSSNNNNNAASAGTTTAATAAKQRSKPTRNPMADGADTIPNIAHFVYGLKDPAGDLNFTFYQYVSAYSAWYNAKAHTLYLHTNAGEDALRRARSGAMGKWTKAIFDIPGFKVNYVKAPTHAGNGVKLGYLEAISDLMRVASVRDPGGYYIDWDVYIIRDLAPLRKAGFRGIVGRQRGPEYNSGTFMAAPGSLFLKNWEQEMNRVYDGTWTRHSNGAMITVAVSLVRMPGEMLVLDQDAFAPLGWDESESVEFFAPHNETAPLLETLGWTADEIDSDKDKNNDNKNKNPPSLDLPEFVEGDATDRPPWARDWSATYLLHGFKIRRSSNGHVPGFDHMTPKYVLDRQSNVARAVYPIVRDMYYRGLVKITDKHDQR